MDFIESMNAKWRMELFKICVGLAAIGSVAEVAIYWYDSTHRTLFLPLALYRARFIYIPSSLNIIVIVVTYLCLKSEKMTNTQKNVSACLLIYFRKTYVYIEYVCSGGFLIKTLPDNIRNIIVPQCLFEFLFPCRIDTFADTYGCRPSADLYRMRI